MKEYFKIKKIDNKREFINQINTWMPIKQFNIFLWSIKHILKIKNKEMHSHFIKSNELKEDIKYAKLVFKRCLNIGIINKKYSKIDIEKILT